MSLQRRKHPSFCIITPATPQYLDRFATKSTTHLVLAHIADKNPAYAQFYKKLSKQGHYIIMDNGAFELGESYDPDRLVKLGHQVGAHSLVLPDYPFQPADKTIEAAVKYTSVFKSEGFQTFFVPQSATGDWDDWRAGYRWAASEPDIDIIGMSILGIPNALPHIPAAYARVVATELLQRSGEFAFNKYHHYLGLNAGPNLEIPALLKMNAIDTCDSSNPVWMAICGHQYSTNTDSYLSVKKAKKEVEFDYDKLDEDTAKRIDYNIDLTLNLFNK